MIKKDKLPYLTKLIRKLAPKIGAKVVVEPEWGIVSQITFKNGVVRFLFGYLFDLNNYSSVEIATDKGYAKFFMKKMGYPVAEGKTFYSDEWAKAIKSNQKIFYAKKYAKKLGYPVIIKPNSKSQGSGVRLVWNEKELDFGLKEIFKKDKVAIVERYLPGKDYRIVVLDGEIISAYQLVPPSIVGDGRSSIISLLKKKTFTLRGKDRKINLKDRRIEDKLLKQGLNFRSVLKKGQRVFILDNANLSSGGEAINVLNNISVSFQEIAKKLTSDMGLRIAGVDLMITTGDITKNSKDCDYYIIEINSSPGLEPTERVYLKVLKALAR